LLVLIPPLTIKPFSMDSHLQCPVDFIPINETQVRLTALQVFLLSLIFIWIPSPLLTVLLAIDFGLRAFRRGKVSPLHIVSGQLIKQFSLPYKPIDQAPKRFAALVGLVFSLALLLLSLSGNLIIAQITAGVLSIFAALESFFGFCAGCYVYDFYKKIIRS
jgi:Domain of unknown function (DUF4395)